MTLVGPSSGEARGTASNAAVNSFLRFSHYDN